MRLVFAAGVGFGRGLVVRIGLVGVGRLAVVLVVVVVVAVLRREDRRLRLIQPGEC